MTVPVKSPEIRGCCWANPQTSRPPSGESAARRTGWLPRQPCRRRTTSPASRLGHSAATQWKSSLHRLRFRLVNRQPFSVSDPKASDRLSVGPGWRALSGTGHILSVASWQVKGYFRIHRVVHETFRLPTDLVGSSTVHTQRYPQFRSCSAPVVEPATRRPRRGRLSDALTTGAADRLNSRRDRCNVAPHAWTRRDHHDLLVRVDFFRTHAEPPTGAALSVFERTADEIAGTQ